MLGDCHLYTKPLLKGTSLPATGSHVLLPQPTFMSTSHVPDAVQGRGAAGMGQAQPLLWASSVYDTGGKHKARSRIQPSTLCYLAGTLFLPGGSSELLAPS